MGGLEPQIPPIYFIIRDSAVEVKQRRTRSTASSVSGGRAVGYSAKATGATLAVS